jgi:hypothetical protein
MKRVLLASLALGCSLAAGSARAEDLTYEFDDDLLGAEGIDSKAALIKVRQPRGRVTLIRPRASFVPELLKSIEHI